jgi:predicted KAP-like P-loop ATPase
MTEPHHFNDAPIISPDDDQFGIDPFAQAIAKSFTDIRSPVGATIALNGAWGSGKSSAVNLIRYHLAPAEKCNKLTVIDFKCWWFRGEEALTLAFLQELNGALENNIGKKGKDLIAKLGRKLLQTGPVIGPAINAATGSPLGSIFSGALKASKDIFSEDESIEKIFNDLSIQLANQTKRFLVIIDDIDRLTSDEALLVFRLAKSVGRLPNVMYLLVFDRDLAEQAVQEKYPSEGPHFLEKIIQASFEVPLPARDDLNNAIFAEVEKYCGSPTDDDQMKYFMNVFYDVIAPYINSPRDVRRLSNAISVSWPPIAGEVNLADYVALETMRLFEPKLYNSIRMSKDQVTGHHQDYGGKDNREQILQSFVDLASEKHRDQVKPGLERLFPRLEQMGYGPEFLNLWAADRRACSERHFDTYFRMSLGNETLSIKEIDDFIENSGDQEFIRRTLRNAVTTVRRNRRSNIPLLFDELIIYGARIPKENFKPVLSSIFEIADEINREEDNDKGMFSFGSTYLRIHWLVRKLTFNRCDLEERSEIFLAACKKSALGWLIDFTSSAMDDHEPKEEGKRPEPPEKCLVSKDDLGTLKRFAIEKIETAAANGELIAHSRLAYILFRWRDFRNDKNASVKAWTNETLLDNASVASFARAFTSESWSQSGNDLIATRQVTAVVESLDSIMDVELFKKQLEKLKDVASIDSADREIINTFLEAWTEKEKGKE